MSPYVPKNKEKLTMITTDKHCELLSASIREKIAAIYGSFRLFFQLFSGIVGGAIALSLSLGPQNSLGLQNAPPAFVSLANALTAGVAIMCAVMIVDAQLAWYRFRKRLSEVAGRNEKGRLQIPPPKPVRPWLTVGTMLAAMFIAVVAFMTFNPLPT